MDVVEQVEKEVKMDVMQNAHGVNGIKIGDAQLGEELVKTHYIMVHIVQMEILHQA